MQDQTMREELKAYYWQGTGERAEAFCQKCIQELDSLYKPDMSSYQMKALQYRVITDRLDPVLFYHVPYYFETGTMWAHCDGARDFRGHRHAGIWTYSKNKHIFEDQDPQLWQKRWQQDKEIFYLICGAYNDDSQHFNYDLRPIFRAGLKDIYRRAQEALQGAQTETEKQFLSAMCEGLLCWKKLGEKFADKARQLLPTSPDEQSKFYMQRIADTAGRVPWEKPETLYEALNTCAFVRKALGSLEGIGPNTFGRLDMDLEPFYRHDIQNGILTPEQAYDLIRQFLVTFDMHYDHDMKMVKYSDHELENTFTLGGCDSEGKPVYNELTSMFLCAAREAKVIFPKIKCRISSTSPREYLDDIDRAVVAGTSTVLYHNDDAEIPALVRAGVPLELARDYIVSGCWGVTLQGVEKYDHGGYVNLLRTFEFALHRLDERMEKVGMHFEPLDGSPDFETLYKRVCANIKELFRERSDVTHKGGHVWSKVDPLPLFSTTLQDCIQKRRDVTDEGAKYLDDVYLMVGFPNIVDSLMAIKTLCFDQKKYTLAQMLDAVRNNWEGNAVMRAEAMACPGWGDGSDESCRLANRFNNDIYDMLGEFTGTHGGKIRMGHLTYTEVRFWGEKTLATPDGRKNGDYISQGLTPSRLKKIPAVTDVIHSLQALDPSTMAGGGVINIILPSDKVDLDRCAAFLYATTHSAMQSLQLNCVTREQLLDAQKHPEKYPDLIVRVTGFSAKFTSLSPEWQQEVLTRNFYA